MLVFGGAFVTGFNGACKSGRVPPHVLGSLDPRFGPKHMIVTEQAKRLITQAFFHARAAVATHDRACELRVPRAHSRSLGIP